MSFTYSQYVTNIANMLVVSSTDVNFAQMIPSMIDDAEQRCYRDLDFINTVQVATSLFTAGSRRFTLPSLANGTFYVVNNLYAITPSTAASVDTGTRNPLLRAGRSFIDQSYPNSNGSGVPAYFSMTTQTSGIVGPWPDQAYMFEVVATIHPTPLSSTNVTTILSVYTPDLFFAASMVFAVAYQQNFGAAAQTDNPAMATNWEGHYQALKQSAAIEEARKKASAEGWSTQQPSQIATPPRT